MLSGLKLWYYNIMSYKYRDIVLKSGQVVLGHWYFDVSEKIIIPSLKMAFKTPKEHQVYHDGHHLISFCDIKSNRAAEIKSDAEKIESIQEMLNNKPEAKKFVDQHKEYFKDLCDLDESRDSVGVEFDSLYIPWVSPQDDYKDAVDTTIEQINRATNHNGMFGDFKFNLWYVLLFIGGALVVTKYFKMW